MPYASHEPAAWGHIPFFLLLTSAEPDNLLSVCVAQTVYSIRGEGDIWNMQGYIEALQIWLYLIVG